MRKSDISAFILKAMKAPELKEKLEESEKLIKELTVTWEEKAPSLFQEEEKLHREA